MAEIAHLRVSTIADDPEEKTVPEAAIHNPGRGLVRPSEPRIIELDGVRGIAAAMVLIFHLPRHFWFGATGVDLFFVLSGFLITGIILKNRDRDGFLKVFYARRALRIFPIYYLAMLGMVLINMVRSQPGRLDGLGYYLTYTQCVPRYWGGETPPLDFPVNHTWTLAIEEQFYLLWPLAMTMLRVKHIPLLCSFLIVTPCILRYFGLNCMTLLGHTDGLAWGGLWAWLEFSFGPTHRRLLNRVYFLLLIAGFAGYYALWMRMSQLGYSGNEMVQINSGIAVLSVAYAGLVGIVQAMSGSRWLSFLRWRPFVALGSVSYGLYLYHWIIYSYLDTLIKFKLDMGDTWWLDVLKVTLSVSAAALSWICLEKPILRLKDRVSYGGTRRASVLPAAAEAATGV